MVENISNPFQSPNRTLDPRVRVEGRSGLRKAIRWIAFILVATPILAAYPIQYWTFNLAGGWFVSNDLEPEHRAAFLGLGYLQLMFCVVVFSLFLAFLLLWIDRCKPLLTGMLTILSGLFLVPAGILAWILISSYIEFG